VCITFASSFDAISSSNELIACEISGFMEAISGFIWEGWVNKTKPCENNKILQSGRKFLIFCNLLIVMCDVTTRTQETVLDKCHKTLIQVLRALVGL
jgi:hypothetical protein